MVSRISMRTSYLAVVVILVDTAVAVAQPEKWSDPPYIQLSKNMTPDVRDLPSLGSIDWTLMRIPFIDDSPRAGISGAGMCAVDGRIYLLGGFIPAGDGSDDQASRRTSKWAYRYDPASRKWTRLPDMPARREYTRAIATEDAIYVVGGSMQRRGHPDGELVASDCFKLDLSNRRLAWERLGKLSEPRTHMGVGRVGNHLVVAGGVRWDPVNGYHASTVKGTTDVFDLTRPQRGWHSRSSMPGVGRGWVAAASCQNSLYVFSGLTFDENKNSTWVDACLKYDPVSDRWNRIARPPVWVSGWAAATYRERYIVIVGGCVGPTTEPYSNANLWNDLAFVYDTATKRWGKLAGTIPPAAVYNDAGVVILGDTIYVVGGEGPRGSHFNHCAIGRLRFH